MKSNLGLLALTALVCQTASVQAFELKSATVTLGVERYSFGNGTADETAPSLSAAFDIGLTDQIGVDFGISHNGLEIATGPNNYQAHLRPYYQFQPGLDAGLFIDHSIVDHFDGGATERRTVYGLDVNYAPQSGFGGSAYVGKSRKTVDLNETVSGLSLGYRFAGGFDVGTYYKKTKRDDVGVTTQRYGLMVGYLIEGTTLPFPIYVSGFVGRSEFSVTGSSDHEQIGLSLTIPFGNTNDLGRGKRPSAPGYDASYD